MTAVRTITRNLDGYLAPLGFARLGSVWNRRDGLWVDVIDIQVSNSQRYFVVNVGVLEVAIYERCWKQPPPTPVPIGACIVATRLGALSGGSDTWWGLDDAGQTPQIVRELERDALPFLQRLHSTLALDQRLTPSRRSMRPDELAYLALIKVELGLPELACAMLREKLPKVVGDLWPPRIRELMAEIGCISAGQSSDGQLAVERTDTTAS